MRPAAPELGYLALHAVAPDGVEVIRADAEIGIPQECYDTAVNGRLLGCWAGEGMFVVTAVNGTWRYRLTEYDAAVDLWAATLIEQHETARPTQ